MQDASVALLYHGSYERQEDECTGKGSDFFDVASNHKERLVEPLQRMNMQVLTVFHTYHAACAARDAALVSFLQPVAYRFDTEGSLPRIVDSYLVALDLANSSGLATIDYVVLTRFDVLYTQSIDVVRWDQINVASPGTYPGRCSDLFHAAPWRLVGALRAALDDGRVDGTGHGVCQALAEIAPRVLRFVQDVRLPLGADSRDLCAPPSQRGLAELPFVYIFRSCVADACVPTLRACIDNQTVDCTQPAGQLSFATTPQCFQDPGNRGGRSGGGGGDGGGSGNEDFLASSIVLLLAMCLGAAMMVRRLMRARRHKSVSQPRSVATPGYDMELNSAAASRGHDDDPPI